MKPVETNSFCLLAALLHFKLCIVYRHCVVSVLYKFQPTYHSTGKWVCSPPPSSTPACAHMVVCADGQNVCRAELWLSVCQTGWNLLSGIKSWNTTTATEHEVGGDSGLSDKLQTPRGPCMQTMRNAQAPLNSFLVTCHAKHSNSVRYTLTQVSLLQGFICKGKKRWVILHWFLGFMSECMQASGEGFLIEGQGSCLSVFPFHFLLKKFHLVSCFNKRHRYSFIVQH